MMSMCKNCEMENAMPTDTHCWNCEEPLTNDSTASACSLDDLKVTFIKALASMSDRQIIEAFREIGCEVTIKRKENA
jgi:hypothetical protein